jgi:hypothetical protein
MGIEKRYGYCICHDKYSPLNSKGLCPIGAKERHERSAASKNMVVKKKRNEKEIKKENGFDNALRNDIHKSLGIFSTVYGDYRKPQLAMEVQKQAAKKKTKINHISKEKAKENTELARLKKTKILEIGKTCEMCGKHGEVDLFHIIGVGDKKHSTNPVNTILSCRFCHLVWGANDWSKIVKFKNFDEIMERLKSLDEGKYWKLKHKIDEYYAKSN